MENSKIKTAPNRTNADGNMSSSSNSKIKTSPKIISSKLPNFLSKENGSYASYSGRRKNNYSHANDDKGDSLGGIDTYNTTDTGRQIIEIATPKVRTVSRKILKVTVKVTSAVHNKVRTKVLEKKDIKDIKEKLRENGKVRTSKANTVYKKIGSVRVEKDISVNRSSNITNQKHQDRSRRIKTGGYKSKDIKTALERNNSISQKTTIRAGSYNINGYKLKKKLNYVGFKQSNAKVNESDTGNTSYEAVQDAREKLTKVTNIVKTGRNITTATKQIARTVGSIKKEKVDVSNEYSPKIKTGRYVDVNKKRTLEGSKNSRQVANIIQTGQVKADIKIDRLEGRGEYTRGKEKLEKFSNFSSTNAVVQEKDTSNSSIEAIHQSRIVTNKVKNTSKGIKNTYKGIKNIKTSVKAVGRQGKKIYTRHRSKVRTRANDRKYGAKDIKGKGNLARKSVAATQNAAIKMSGLVKKAKTMMNPLVIKGVIIGGVFILFMSIITSIVGGIAGSGGISYSYILTEPEIIIEAKGIVDTLNNEATEEINELLESNGYDDIQLEGPDKIEVGFQDILAIMGVEDEQEYKIDKIDSIHKMFYEIDTREEIYQEEEYVGEVHNDDEFGNCTGECYSQYETVDKKRLIISVEQYNFIKVMDTIGFDEEQQNWGMNLAGCNLLDLYPDLTEAGITIPQGSLTQDQVNDILSKLPSTGATRENIVAIAESLVGKIAYGWGSKADPPSIPSQLDCSGFTDYVFKLAGAGTIGAGTYGQWDKSYPINQDEIKIGDLGFLKPPSQASDNSPNHVGIFAGYDSNGNMMFVHCQGGTGTVKTTVQAAGFHYFRRPFVNFSGE